MKQGGQAGHPGHFRQKSEKNEWSETKMPFADR